MRLRAVAAELPSREVGNADVVDLIAEHSADTFTGDLDALLRRVDVYLRHTGSRTRRWLDAGERPVDLLRAAARTALRRAGLEPGQVDLLVYTGVGRGFLEPAGAYHAAAALGADRAHCFDLLDACMSWTRAVQVVESLFLAGHHRTALVVNAEFSMRPGGAVVPGAFRLPAAKALASTFAACTLGEAATATVLTADDGEPWRFSFRSRPDLAPLCNVTLDNYRDFCDPTGKEARNGVGVFTSFGLEMHARGREEALAALAALDVPPERVDALFTHASSSSYWQGMADEAGLGPVVHHVYPRTGNVVSASVPTAMASGIEAGLLKPGQRAVGWVGSAGMSFGAFTFVL
ncbi:3-oxoacyl-ACP reductase [Actinosynnema pretiosum subsp. pretiosum]|uniref:3-Oxoacyl-(Acyl-carrier-protein (ACP)) synthase III domain protein n=2 Tax=Actinosynnema TaxID=40566 RepID=C6W824_ACTMD|nr:3-oxoacyl-[acyl-carrier-protein] synthase III C-terminal domain-containing protein [Actinosynnema mirum]ACU37045.1 3-Oxoacyl-(acyl-carrier-protein (ACP)) synthase III domain protein [Actinosynnema mirum DSM 43827]AXX30527.1 3-oxoacyl-[acyl-carrier-protein] synthase, KASIII [Actinosynnema pretiosum subsp. pretiosum]QUF05333.1 3-oxoacyl-ACP reductase [Actinosynnema pretiosum subsp. pretiosum]